MVTIIAKYRRLTRLLSRYSRDGKLDLGLKARGLRLPSVQLMIDLHCDNSQLDVYLRARREMLAKYQIKQQNKER
jgi:hypothetical protein